MTDQIVPTPASRSIRDRTRAALLAAAHDCNGNCGRTEADCVATHPIQVTRLTHGAISDIEGPIDAIADAVLAVRDDEIERLRARVARVRRYLELTADSCRVGHRGVAQDALRLLDGDAATHDARG